MTKTATSNDAPKTKRTQLIALLERKRSPSLDLISTSLGWLPHTTRAAISGLRKAGYEVETIKGEKGSATAYKLVSRPREIDQGLEPSGKATRTPASTQDRRKGTLTLNAGSASV